MRNLKNKSKTHTVDEIKKSMEENTPILSPADLSVNPTTSNIKTMQERIGNPENTFEMDLSPKSIGDLRSQELELEHEKLELAKMYLSLDVDQKTEIQTSERTILSALQILGYSPYSISAKHYPAMNNIKSHILIDYIQNYFRLGIPLKRKGRDEESKVLAGVFDSTQVEAYNPNMQTNNKLIKG